MAHFALIDEDFFVVNVIVIPNDKEENGTDYINNDLNLEGNWIKTSYNTIGGVHYDPETKKPSKDQSKALRKNYAAIGFYYDKKNDAFIPPQPFSKWVLNEDTCQWEAPVPYPQDDKFYVWNDNKGEWEEVVE